MIFSDFDPESGSPRTRAELVPREVLYGLRPAAGFGLGNSLIEEYFQTGNQTLLDDGLEVIDTIAKAGETRTPRARLFMSCTPLFVARAERRHPDDRELTETIEALSDALLDIRDALVDDESFDDYFGKQLTDTQRAGLLNNVRGVVGEYGVVYTGAYDNLFNESDIYLGPSMHREDCPDNQNISALFARDAHDVSSYEPEPTDIRARISSRNAPKKSSYGDVTAAKFNLWNRTRIACSYLNDQRTYEVPPPTLSDVIGIITLADDDIFKTYPDAFDIRDTVACRLAKAVNHSYQLEAELIQSAGAVVSAEPGVLELLETTVDDTGADISD